MGSRCRPADARTSAVGGLTLGGGENLLMARYGAVCDNVLATDVVVADGRLVAANAREHADLFWAIRGGGGKFGIVTSFEYRLVPSRLRDVGELGLSSPPNGGGPFASTAT